MRRFGRFVAASAALAMLVGGSAWAGDEHGKDQGGKTSEKEPKEAKKRKAKVEIDPQVGYARSWDAAVEEAKLLKVPIVVHSHGFYCGPCWGLHSAILKNKKYIEFADKGSVEVICLGRLDEGIQKEDERAETYETERDGKTVECLVEFPGLTVAEMLALASSKAGTYNNTGGVPYTCVVDPFTLQELEHWKGGSVSGGTLIEAVTLHAKALVKEHGKGLARKDLRAVAELEAKVGRSTEKGEYVSALADLTKAASKAKEWPETLTERLTKAKEAVVAAATAELERIVSDTSDNPAEAKKALTKLQARAKGTGLEERIARALAAVQPAAGS